MHLEMWYKINLKNIHKFNNNNKNFRKLTKI